mgnify:FL=1
MSLPLRIVGWEAMEARDQDSLRATGTVVTIGVFDGLHRGHQRLLGAALRLAAASGLQRLHVGFEPHPDLLLRGSLPLRLLDDVETALRLADMGVGQMLDLRFDSAMRATPWEEFLARLVAATGARSIVLSPESAFGKDRAGTLPLLRGWGSTRGIQVHPVAEARAGGAAISSTRIRRAIATGDLAAAAGMLGRPHAVSGHLRGKTLHLEGDPAAFALPPSGEYRVRLGRAARAAGRLPLTGRLTLGRLDHRAGTIEFPSAALGGRPRGRGRDAEPFEEGGALRAALLAGRVGARSLP